MNVDRERIRKQSKEVATYMMKPKKYHVEWDCPHCGNSHNWWWEEEFEAYDDGECDMVCDRCDTRVRCVGDGNGFYEPVKDEKRRLEELESLELDLHNYVRGLEDKVNTNNKLAFDAVNTVTMRLIELENTVAEQRSELDNLSGRTTQAELAVWRLENDIKVPGSAKLGPQHIALAKEMEKSENAEIKMGMWGMPIMPKPQIGDLNIRGDGDHTLRVFNGKEWIPAMQDLDTSLDERILKQLNEQPTKSVEKRKKEPSFLDLIHGHKQPFHYRLREGCQFTKEELPPEKLASVLRFIAVEVERMTERDMGGSFTVSNLEVARQLRELASDALVEDYIYDPDHGNEDDEANADQ